MIRLYLVRHGIAIDAEEWKGAPDGTRPLTDKGRRRFRKAARAFGKHERRLDLILTSPLVRAVQTAEILAGELKHGEVAVLEELASGGVAALLAAVAARAQAGRSIALVGHEPQLSAVLATLARLTPEKAEDLDFRKGAIVRLDVSGLPDPETALLRWWVKPRSGGREKGLPLRPAEPPQPTKPVKARKPAKATPTASTSKSTRKTRPAKAGKAAK